MAHHRHHRSTTTSTPRPFLLRALSITALLLPAILYIVSLSTVLKSIYNPNFALSNRISPDNGTQPALLFKASPFYNCQVTDTDVFDATLWNNTCTRRPALGKKGIAACAQTSLGSRELCKKVVTSAELFVAGSALIGVAMLAAMIVAVMGFSAATAATEEARYSSVPSGTAEQTTHHEDGKGGGVLHSMGTSVGTGPSTLAIATPFLTVCATVLAVLAAGCIILGQVLGVDGLVNSLRPTSSIDTDFQTYWYMGSAAMVFPSVAWLAAILGAMVAASGCGVLGR